MTDRWTDGKIMLLSHTLTTNTYLMTNSVDPDLHCWQKQVYPGSASPGLILFD